MHNFLGIILLISCAIAAEKIKRPLYEWGVAGFYAELPDYPTAASRQIRSLVVPAIIYRGEGFRSDEDGTRAILNDKDSPLKLEFSFGGSFPANSENNEAREGMPNLEWTFEIGLRAVYQVQLNRSLRLRVMLPVRPAFVVGEISDWTLQGYRIGSDVGLEKIFYWDKDKLIEVNLWWGTNYLSRGLAAYFFDVRPRYETARRDAYKAPAGFLGHDLSISASIQKNRSAIFMGVLYNDYSEAVVQDSPLYKNPYNTVALVGFSYFFGQSTRLER